MKLIEKGKKMNTKKWFELKIKIGRFGKGAKICLEVNNDGEPSDAFWKSRYTDKDIFAVVEPVKRETMKQKIDKIETKKRSKK